MSSRIYISGALIGSENLIVARSKYESCAVILRNAGYEPYLPHQNTDPDLKPDKAMQDVFLDDVQALMSSDAVVAFLDEPSHGVGAEVAICIARKVPIIALVQSNVRVSRFILGMIEKGERSTVVVYSDTSELADILPKKVSEAIRLKRDNNEDGLTALLRRV